MNVLARKPKIKIAEFAGHDDIVIDCHMVQIVGRKALQNARQTGARATAAEGQGPSTIGRDTFGVEQPVQQAIWRQLVVQKFPIG